MPEPTEPKTVEEAIGHWPDLAGLGVRPAPDAGLINRTYLVGDPPQAVLQWVNPIFHPSIHVDIAALTEHLATRGLTTPRVVPTGDGELWLDDEPGWRVLSFVPGRTVHRLQEGSRARAAGDLVGRFHAAVAGWDHAFAAPRRDIHDTDARMADLRRALDDHPHHPLAVAARDVGSGVLDAWQRWRDEGGRLDLPRRPCHGDLKISNLRFADDGTGICLIDLDTVGPQTLAAEMGDAWRSWCNPAGEDDPQTVHFDVDLFAASGSRLATHLVDLDAAEHASLVPGIERICLELASRFCADAVVNGYFREDRQRHPEPGSHNLLRARCQLRLAASARAVRDRCHDILDLAAGA